MQELSVRVVGATKLLGNLIRPMIMSAEDEYFDECQIHITSERSYGDAMPRKLAGSCNDGAQSLTCQSIRLVYGRLVRRLNSYCE